MVTGQYRPGCILGLVRSMIVRQDEIIKIFRKPYCSGVVFDDARSLNWMFWISGSMVLGDAYGVGADVFLPTIYWLLYTPLIRSQSSNMNLFPVTSRMPHLPLWNTKT